MGENIMLIEDFDDCDGFTLLYVLKKCLNALDNSMLLNGRQEEHSQIKKCLLIIEKLLPDEPEASVRKFVCEIEGISPKDELSLNKDLSKVQEIMMRQLFAIIGNNIWNWWC